MVITKYISKSCVVPELQAKNKSDALKELTHLLFQKKKLKDVGAALDQIVARESTASTGIGNGIAVPHARVPGMNNLACAVGRAPKGLDFLAVDRKPVDIVFLICYPPTQQTTYLNFVATVAKLLSDVEQRKQLLAAGTAEEMYEILKAMATEFADSHEESFKQLQTESGLANVRDGHADLILLARLQLHQEMLAAAKSGKKRIQERIDAITSLIDPRIMKHYDRLTKSRPPALVPVEGDTCQGCFIKLPSQFVQHVRQDNDHIHTCTNCSRYIYVV